MRQTSDYRLARACFWVAALSFGSLGVRWSVSSEGYSLATQLIVSAVIGAIAGAGLAWALWEVRKREKQKSPPKEISVDRDEAVDLLARELYWKLEQMDPSESGPWETLSEDEQCLYRDAIRWLLMRPDLFAAALGK